MVSDKCLLINATPEPHLDWMIFASAAETLRVSSEPAGRNLQLGLRLRLRCTDHHVSVFHRVSVADEAGLLDFKVGPSFSESGADRLRASASALHVCGSGCQRHVSEVQECRAEVRDSLARRRRWESLGPESTLRGQFEHRRRSLEKSARDALSISNASRPQRECTKQQQHESLLAG